MKKNQSGKALFVQFDSWEEMETFKLNKMKNRTDMEKFKAFIALMRLSKMLKDAPKQHKKC